MAGDPYFDNVALLIHMEGSDGATSTTDESQHQHFPVFQSNANLSTAQSAVGSSSLLVDGSIDRVSVGSDFDFSFLYNLEEDFTLECYLYLTGSLSTRYPINSNATNNPSFSIRLVSTGILAAYIKNASGQSVTVSTTSAITTDAWYHVAVDYVKATNTLSIYLDGVFEASGNPSTTWPVGYSFNGLTIGGTYSNSGMWIGYIDEVRVTKGVARYQGGNFTPPSIAYPDYGGEITGTLTESLAATQFDATLTTLDGAYLQSFVINSSPFTLQCKTTKPVLLTLAPQIGSKWAASTAYALNDKVFPTDPVTTPYYYECTTAGTSNSTEPTWPTTPGSTVVDGTATWQCVERMVQPITQGPLVPS